MENKVYKVLSEWKLDNLKEKFKGKEICRLWIYICMDEKVSIVLQSLQFSQKKVSTGIGSSYWYQGYTLKTEYWLSNNSVHYEWIFYSKLS